MSRVDDDVRGGLRGNLPLFTSLRGYGLRDLLVGDEVMEDFTTADMYDTVEEAVASLEA